jgi:putative peptidoglycan binding protein/N-acetylmuramoyl-L-alanine amidase-like protein
MSLPPSICKKPLKLGSSGKVVRWWQELLKRKGYMVDVDGKFGPKTLNATRAAQAWAGVKIDGIVGPTTWQAVDAKKRTRRPLSTVRNVVRPPGVSPKILDCRPGRNGFPNGPGDWSRRIAKKIVAKLGHYTGGPGSFLGDARFHTGSSYLTAGGAPALAYHIGVDKDGTLMIFNGWDEITWHCDGGHNGDTLGIVFRGGSEGPSLAQRRTLTWLWKQLGAGTFRPFKAEKIWPRLVPSTTHRHVNSTSCPGEKGEAFYRSISSDFRTKL